MNVEMSLDGGILMILESSETEMNSLTFTTLVSFSGTFDSVVGSSFLRFLLRCFPSLWEWVLRIFSSISLLLTFRRRLRPFLGFVEEAPVSGQAFFFAT